MTSTPGATGTGRFYELQEELGGRRRGPYRLTDDIVIQPITRGQLKAMRAAQSEDEQLEILLGDQYAAVEALYAERPFDDWLAFQHDLYAFLFGAGAAELPGGSEGS
ncbi:hypothetical protein [Nocardia sp. NPDC050175]|uniref:hypothetical protein n=1 Tax=Nocardia sp. NPDC050175 TaxID=3364317 RepID=UPI003790CADD